MARIIVKTLLVLLLALYGAGFLAWNMAPQEIITLQFGSFRYSESMPVGVLPFAGLVLGFVVMAVVAWTTWAAQKAIATKAVGQVKKAKEKLQAQLDAIGELRTQVAQLEADLAACRAGDGTWGAVSAGDVTIPAVAPASMATGNTSDAADDPDVI